MPHQQIACARLFHHHLMQSSRTFSVTFTTSSLLTPAAYGGWKPAPTSRLRRTSLHLRYSIVPQHVLDTAPHRPVLARYVGSKICGGLAGNLLPEPLGITVVRDHIAVPQHYGHAERKRSRPSVGQRPPHCCRADNGCVASTVYRTNRMFYVFAEVLN